MSSVIRNPSAPALPGEAGGVWVNWKRLPSPAGSAGKNHPMPRYRVPIFGTVQITPLLTKLPRFTALGVTPLPCNDRTPVVVDMLMKLPLESSAVHGADTWAISVTAPNCSKPQAHSRVSVIALFPFLSCVTQHTARKIENSLRQHRLPSENSRLLLMTSASCGSP